MLRRIEEVLAGLSKIAKQWGSEKLLGSVRSATRDVEGARAWFSGRRSAGNPRVLESVPTNARTITAMLAGQEASQQTLAGQAKESRGWRAKSEQFTASLNRWVQMARSERGGAVSISPSEQALAGQARNTRGWQTTIDRFTRSLDRWIQAARSERGAAVNLSPPQRDSLAARYQRLKAGGNLLPLRDVVSRYPVGTDVSKRMWVEESEKDLGEQKAAKKQEEAKQKKREVSWIVQNVVRAAQEFKRTFWDDPRAGGKWVGEKVGNFFGRSGVRGGIVGAKMGGFVGGRGRGGRRRSRNRFRHREDGRGHGGHDRGDRRKPETLRAVQWHPCSRLRADGFSGDAARLPDGAADAEPIRGDQQAGDAAAGDGSAPAVGLAELQELVHATL